jgi:general secretion pathway protein C
MLARFMAFSVWLLLGGSVAYWGLQLFSRPLAMPPSVLPAGDARATQVDLGRLLGVAAPEAAPEPQVAPSTRLRLLGVVAPKSTRAAEAGEGVALIEVDGVPRTVRVGAVVDGELRLLRVDARSASLGRVGEAPAQVLEISPPAAPMTGSLPPAAPSPVVLGGNPPGTVAQMPMPVQAPPHPQPAAAPSAYGLPLAASAASQPPQQQVR